MPTLGVYNYVDVPAPPVARGGVLAAARVIDVTDPHDLLGAQYLTDACAVAQTWEEFCTMVPAAAKVFAEGPDVVQGEPFAVYAGVECTLQRLDEGADRARNQLDYGEGRQIDAAIGEWLAAEAVEIGTGPYPMALGLGIAEAYIGTYYGGVGTILFPRVLVPCACAQHLVGPNLDGTLTTCQGSKVASILSGQVFDPPESTGATGWLYVTGQITLLRGDVQVISVPQQPQGDGTYEMPRALAERIYVPLIECLAAKVEVTCE